MANEETNAQPSKGGSNRTLIIILVIVGVLVILGIIGRFAWSWVAKKATTEIAEEAIEQSTGGEVEINEGTWPSSLASELQYPGSTVTSSADFSAEGKTSSTVGLESTATLNDVYGYYTGLSGWTVSYKYIETTSKVGSVSMKKGSDTATVSITEEEGKTSIAIVVGQE